MNCNVTVHSKYCYKIKIQQIPLMQYLVIWKYDNPALAKIGP